MNERLYCPLYPCIEPGVARPAAYTGQSFATRAAYERHIEKGHYIAAANAPEPYVITRSNRYTEEVA